MTATRAPDKPAARPVPVPAPAPATGTAVLPANPALKALEDAEAHGKWIVAVGAAYAKAYDTSAELAEVMGDYLAGMAEVADAYVQLGAGELAHVAHHQRAHDTYVALVCKAPVDMLPAPFSLPVPAPCPPHVRELTASPMGRLADRLDAEEWPEVSADA